MNAVEFNLKINKLNKTWQKYILLKQSFLAIFSDKYRDLLVYRSCT